MSGTLLDVLSSLQFRTVILLTLGLDECQIADLLEISKWTVRDTLCDCFDRTGCQSMEALKARLLYEKEAKLYDKRLEHELAELQTAARRMLENMARANRLAPRAESSMLPCANWVM